MIPTGTVTFLFTDFEGSTRMWDAHRELMQEALNRHDAIMRSSIEFQGDDVFKTVGDAFCASFSSAPAALSAALAIRSALAAERWGEVPIRVRMGLHAYRLPLREARSSSPLRCGSFWQISCRRERPCRTSGCKARWPRLPYIAHVVPQGWRQSHAEPMSPQAKASELTTVSHAALSLSMGAAYREGVRDRSLGLSPVRLRDETHRSHHRPR